MLGHQQGRRHLAERWRLLQPFALARPHQKRPSAVPSRLCSWGSPVHARPGPWWHRWRGRARRSPAPPPGTAWAPAPPRRALSQVEPSRSAIRTLTRGHVSHVSVILSGLPWPTFAPWHPWRLQGPALGWAGEPWHSVGRGASQSRGSNTEVCLSPSVCHPSGLDDPDDRQRLCKQTSSRLDFPGRFCL